MMPFTKYSNYYNLIYKDKDYAAECSFVLERFRAARSLPQSLLDLGCGTGRHALAFARQGLDVTGVDMSPTMLKMAVDNAPKSPDSAMALSPRFMEGDVRTLRLNARYDAAVSLFHVMSYQRTEQDLLAAFATAKNHLTAGGLFFFDFWYGPGVLFQRPEMREKRISDERMLIVRKATPVMDVNANTVSVHYDISITDTETGGLDELHETHTMRYWFLPELRFLADQAGFSIVEEGRWMDTGTPAENDWAAWLLLALKG